MHLSVSFVVLSVLLLSNVDASPVPSLEVSGHENAASDRALVSFFFSLFVVHGID